MTWGKAAGRRDRMQERLAALESEVARLGAEASAAEERRLALADLMDRHADEAADQLAALTRRIEALEAGLADAARADDPIDEARLAQALLPLRLEVAAMARQAAVDEQQAQRAYLELVTRLERIAPGGDARPATLANGGPHQDADGRKRDL